MPPARARGLLESLGLGGVADQPYATLSAGERRRTSIARALMLNPALLLLALDGVNEAERASVVGTFSSFFDLATGVIGRSDSYAERELRLALEQAESKGRRRHVQLEAWPSPRVPAARSAPPGSAWSARPSAA